MKLKLDQLTGRDYVALVLAFALCIAVLFVCTALLYGVIVNERRSVSDAASNLLTMLFGGVIAILGGYVGSFVANGNGMNKDDEGKKDEQDTSTH